MAGSFHGVGGGSTGSSWFVVGNGGGLTFSCCGGASRDGVGSSAGAGKGGGPLWLVGASLGFFLVVVSDGGPSVV